MTRGHALRLTKRLDDIEKISKQWKELSREARESLGFVAPVKGGDEKGREKGENKGKRKIPKELGANVPEESKVMLEALATGVGHLATKRDSVHANTKERPTKTQSRATSENGEHPPTQRERQNIGRKGTVKNKDMTGGTARSRHSEFK